MLSSGTVSAHIPGTPLQASRTVATPIRTGVRGVHAVVAEASLAWDSRSTMVTVQVLDEEFNPTRGATLVSVEMRHATLAGFVGGSCRAATDTGRCDVVLTAPTAWFNAPADAGHASVYVSANGDAAAPRSFGPIVIHHHTFVAAGDVPDSLLAVFPEHDVVGDDVATVFVYGTFAIPLKAYTISVAASSGLTIMRVTADAKQWFGAATVSPTGSNAGVAFIAQPDVLPAIDGNGRQLLFSVEVTPSDFTVASTGALTFSAADLMDSAGDSRIPDGAESLEARLFLPH